MASFLTLPPEILVLIATNLDLANYLRFRMTCRQMWKLFGCEALAPTLKDIKALKSEELEYWYENCQLGKHHYISKGHILSYAYRKNGLTLGLKFLIEKGASLKFISCGNLVEQAARSNDYKSRLSWLTDHGASYHEVRGGINRLCCESYDRSCKSHDKRDIDKFRWLFQHGASLDILAKTVLQVRNRYGPRTAEALRFQHNRLRKVLSAEQIPRPPKKLSQRLRHIATTSY
ncbi:hypothetical protein N7537_010403 [Penicillium hordei]|uniref:F-box domain-containing protein n=1 Tax=Penicillium hordei TaxID=40994 RepID=A0AAD6DW37_9EURO|nr:uncharacterized protein N7537_010403 [Penicillium hordei]KAJ5593499.1 hypothetical protein N7537_010403 [Penicillium hordei]